MKYSKFYSRWYSFREAVAGSFRALFSWRHSWVFLIINLFLQVVAWGESWSIFKRFNGDQLVLHYNVDFGIDLLGDSNQVFTYPLLSLVLFLVNLLWLLSLAKRSDFKFFSYFVWGGLTMVTLFLLSAIFSIYLINFS